MYRFDRRDFLGGTLAASLGGWTALAGRLQAETHGAQGLQLGRFRFDATPPIGHSCCGGWIADVKAVDDSLDAVGLVLLGADKPIVICTVDWCGLLNDAHREWCAALAEAAGTTADRVTVHSVHQHNAPLACLASEEKAAKSGDLSSVVDLSFFRQCLDRARTAVQEAVRTATPLTGIATGQAKVEKVASNRRVLRDEAGHIKAMRGSACKDPKLIELPEGLIDPFLKSVAFYSGEKKLASCYYYATHPMSYYGDGRVTSDFAGLARKQRQQDEPDVLHLYFTGCAGNIAAGKYNDGTAPVRKLLTDRLVDAMRKADQSLQPRKVSEVSWRSFEVLPQARATFDLERLEKQLVTPTSSIVERNKAAYILSWVQRLGQKIPLQVSNLQIDETALLHLPAECFIEYQLRAQKMAADKFVATAAYGDGGPWYIPTKEEYPHGGYEVSVAFCEPSVDDLLTAGIAKVLG